MTRFPFLVAAALGGLGLSPAGALTPPPPCEGVIESNMHAMDPEPLGGWDEAQPTGVVVETYFNATVLEGNVYVNRPAPVPALEGFGGTRVTLCSTGEFLLIPSEEASDVSIGLAATEFLRGQVQRGERVRFADLRRAAEALYGGVTVLRESDQTCACQHFFDELRPADQTPFSQRTDVEQ